MATDRAQLTHAYGSAADTPGLFTRLDGGARNEALLMAGLVVGAGGADERKLCEAQIADTGARLHTLALQGGQGELAVSLTRLFGWARCGECEAVFGVAEALVD
ncbi:hypothetical protein QD712_13685 [Streptomyces acidiscabies]|uniref:hypothetical protein n=1 Tax=Streptomyces acidiscabies TaxID=42234 RepID=UPI0030CE7904